MQPLSKHILVIYTILFLIPLVYYIPPFVAELFQTERFFTTVLSLIVIVPIISYIAIPTSVKITFAFINKKAN